MKKKSLGALLLAGAVGLCSLLPAWAAEPLPPDREADAVCGLVSVEPTAMRVEEQWLTYRVQPQTGGEQSPLAAEIASTWRLRNPNYVLPITQRFLLPVLTSLDSYDQDFSSLTVNGRPLEHTTTLLSPFETDSAHPLESKGLDTLLAEGSLAADLSSLPAKGTLYSLLTTDRPESYRVEVTFRLPAERGLCLAQGFTSYNRGADGTVTLQYTGGKALGNPTFLVVGAQAEELAFATYRQENGREVLLDQSVASLSHKELPWADYLEEQVQAAMGRAAERGATGLTREIASIAREMSLREMVRRIQRQENTIPLDQLLDECFQGRCLAVLQWDQTLRAGEEQMLGVTFRASSGVRNVRYCRPAYPFTFYLNPARGWQHYGPIHLVVQLSEEAPWLIASNVDLDQRSGLATDTLQPPKDGRLSFTLSSQSLLERFLRTSPLVVLAALAVLLLLALATLLRIKRVTGPKPL